MNILRIVPDVKKCSCNAFCSPPVCWVSLTTGGQHFTAETLRVCVAHASSPGPRPVSLSSRATLVAAVLQVCRRVQPAIDAASQHQLALAGGPLNHDDGRGESEQSESSFTTEGHFRQSSPSPSPLDAPRETSETLPKDTKHFGRRRTSLRGGRWVGGVKRPPENVAVPKDSSEDELSTPTSITDSGEDESAAADDVVYISMDVLKVNMLNASNALRALRNVLEASRLASSFPRTGSAPAHSTSGGDDGGSTGNTRKVPWPISMLYGKQRSTGDGEGMGQSAGERLEWPVDVSVVDAITRLLAAVSTFPAIQPVSRKMSPVRCPLCVTLLKCFCACLLAEAEPGFFHLLLGKEIYFCP